MLRLRSQKLDESIIQESSTAGIGYKLNRSYAPALRKVEGEPGVGSGARPSDAAREALVAVKVASISGIEKVLIGEAARSYLYPRRGLGQANCDVVGLLSNKRGAILGEAKGSKLMDSLRQLTASAKALRDRGAEGVVRLSLIVTPLPPYLECPPGLATVAQARGRWTISKPHLPHEYAAAVEATNNIGLDPRYDYLIVREGSFGVANGLGLAISKTGDSFLYTNREWSGLELSPIWGPIRKLKLPETDNASVGVTVVS